MKLKSYSGRIQIIFALLFGVMLFSAMNALLVAKLAIFETKLPFASLEDVQQLKTHSMCLRTNSFVYNNFTVRSSLWQETLVKITYGKNHNFKAHTCSRVYSNFPKFLLSDNCLNTKQTKPRKEKYSFAFVFTKMHLPSQKPQWN